MVKNTIITLVLQEALSEYEQRMVQQLLADALYGFRSARTPAVSYFERAYGDGQTYASEEARENKLLDIEDRNVLAEKLFDVSHRAKVAVVDVPPQVRFTGDGQFEVRYTADGTDGTVRGFELLPVAAQKAMTAAWAVRREQGDTQSIEWLWFNY